MWWKCVDLVVGMGETNSRDYYDIEESTVYGWRNAGKAWRPRPMVLPACLRTVCEDAFYHQLGIELSPRAGGPPG